MMQSDKGAFTKGPARKTTAVRKTKWNQQHVLITSLDIQEVTRRLKNETILPGEWVSWKNRDKYLFYMGKVKDNTFEVHPNSRRMPPLSERQRPFPKVCGIMSETADGGTGICVWLESGLMGALFSGFEIMFGIFFLPVAFSRSETIVVPVELLIIGVICIRFLVIKYWEFVSRRVLEWLTELWDASERTSG